MPAIKKRSNETGTESIVKDPAYNNIKSVFEKMLDEEHGSPVDFELPDSFKKWKPTEYISIRRNAYFTRRRNEDDGIFCLCSPSLGSSSVCDGNCHCAMLYSSCSSNCKCGGLCLNKPFQHRAVKKLKIVETEKCGFGLVADEDIKKDDFVIEYVGEVIDDKSCEERLWKMKRRRDTNFYLCEVNHDMVIDATFKGNRSRFINHSCEPNTEMQKWRIDGETRIGIFASRNIKRGKELTYDYQFVQFGADQDCHCGAKSCRKKLGNRPSKPNLSFSDTSRENLSNGRLDLGNAMAIPYQVQARFQNCIGKTVRIWCSRDKR